MSNPGIAEEIRKALEAATPDWYYNGNEIVSKGNPRVGIGGFLKDEDNHLAANAPEWLRWQQGEIERLRAELEQVKAERDEQKVKKRDAYRSIAGWQERVHDPEVELSEKDKVLEWYADEDTHEIKRRLLGDFAPITLDKGQRARDILAKYAIEGWTRP